MSETIDKNPPGPSRSLPPRLITITSIGGMGGAGQFISGSAAVAASVVP